MKTVLVVEDLPDARRQLCSLAGNIFADARIVAAGTIAQAKLQMSETIPDLALIDIGLPDGSGIELIRELARAHPDTICVVTTVLGDDSHIVGALSAGAKGYLLKGQPPALIERQLHQIEMGIPALSPTIARRIMDHFQRTGPIEAASERLTGREQEVLALIAKGLRNADVAKALEISMTTVASHIKNIYRKLDISSRAEATQHAARIGLL